ncbi:MAG: hypothetical protein AB1634_05875 [Thermodesulfobacteriota bacterium]
MRRATLPLLVAVLCFLLTPVRSKAAAVLTPAPPLKTEAKIRDVSVSADGQWTFVLAEGGTVLLYGPQGELVDRLQVPADTTGIAVWPDGSRLLASSAGKPDVAVYEVELVVAINVEGSPFKGPATAPVTVAVFSDFQ